jgi:WD40 repeat protein
MGKSEGVCCVQFARDGRLATGGADGVVRVWGEEGRRLLYAFSGHPGRVLSVAWSNHIEQRWLASGGDDGTFNIWDTHHGRLLRSVPGHTGAVSSIGWAGPYESVYTAGEDGTVRWGFLESGACAPLVPPSEYRGHVVATSSSYSVTFGGADDSVYNWDAEFQRVDVKQSGYTSRVVAMAWAPNAYLLATATADGTLHLSQFGRGYQARRFAEHGAAVSSVAWSPDGRQLASAGADGTVRVWDVESARELRCLSGHKGRALSVSWAPAGPQLASAGDDGVCLWEPGTGELLGRLPSDATPEPPVWGVSGTWEADKVNGTRLPSMRVVLKGAGRMLTGEVWYFHRARGSPMLEKLFDLEGTLQEDGSADWTETGKSGLRELGAVRGRFTGHTFQGASLRPDGSLAPGSTFELRLVSRTTSHPFPYEY